MTIALREKGIMLESPAIDDGIIKERPLTVVEAMRELTEVRAIPVKMKKTTISVRTDIKGNAFKLFSAIGLKPPPQSPLPAKKGKSCWHKLEVLP